MYQLAPRKPSKPSTEWIQNDTWVCRRHIPTVKLPASASKCWYNRCPSTRPPESTRPPMPEGSLTEPLKAETPKAREDQKEPKNQNAPVHISWSDLEKMGIGELRNQSLRNLRKYASHALGIVGASKIPGGKPALLDRIEKEMGPETPPPSPSSPWSYFAEMGMKRLAEQTISDLRKYAGHELGMKGASKIPGGKPALLKRIQMARQR